MTDPVVFEGTKRGGKYVIVDPSVPGYAETLVERLLGLDAQPAPEPETDPEPETPTFDIPAAVAAFYEQPTNDHTALWQVLESLTDDEDLQHEWEEVLREAVLELPGEALWSFWWDSGPRPMGDMAANWCVAELGGIRWVARAPDWELGEVGYELDRVAASDTDGLRLQARDAIRQTFGNRVPDRIGFGAFIRREDLMDGISAALDDRGWEQLLKLVEHATGIDWPMSNEAERKTLVAAYLGVAMGRAY